MVFLEGPPIADFMTFPSKQGFFFPTKNPLLPWCRWVSDSFLRVLQESVASIAESVVLSIKSEEVQSAAGAWQYHPFSCGDETKTCPDCLVRQLGEFYLWQCPEAMQRPHNEREQLCISSLEIMKNMPLLFFTAIFLGFHHFRAIFHGFRILLRPFAPMVCSVRDGGASWSGTFWHLGRPWPFLSTWRVRRNLSKHKWEHVYIYIYNTLT